MENNIKLIATDLDDTLLNDNSEISDYNKNILKRLMDRGIEVVIATGRPVEAMKSFAVRLENNNDSVVFNGAMVVDGDFNCAFSSPLEKEIVLDIINIYKTKYINDTSLNIYYFKDYIVDKADFKYKTNTEIVYKENKIIGLENFNIEMDVYKMVILGDRHVLNEAKKELSRFNIHTSFSNPNFLEILSFNSNKANALKWICDKKGIDRNNVMAFGDNYNDIEMIEFAGIGVAMENAENDLKEKANYIAYNNNKNGVGIFLKEFFNL